MAYYEEYKVNLPEGELGPWKITHFEVGGKDIPSQFWGHSHRSRYTPEGKYTRLTRKGVLVMSDTPDEVKDCINIIRKATGSMLIHGLGLGMILKAVLNKPEITHVDVVEISPELVELVSPHYNDPRVEFHIGDAYTYQFPKGKEWDIAWHDIWDNITADNVPGMQKLHRRYGKRVKEQYSWCRSMVEYEYKKEQKVKRHRERMLNILRS